MTEDEMRDTLWNIAKTVQSLHIDWIGRRVEEYRAEIGDVHNWNWDEMQGKENDLDAFLEWLRKQMG